MNWFQRHLNETALAISVGSATILVFFSIFGLGFNITFYPWLLELGSLRLSMLAVVLIGCLVLSAIGYGWVLNRKNRSPVFLFSFLPSLLSIVLLLIIQPPNNVFHYAYNITYEIVSPFPLVVLLSWLSALSLIIGWLVLISLENRSISSVNNVVDINLRPHNKKTSSFLNGVYRSNKRLLYAVSCIAGIIILTSISSFFFIRYGYIKSNQPHVSEWSQMPDFSFDYPASYFEPRYSENTLAESVSALEIRFYDTLWDISELIDIQFYDRISTMNILNTVDSYTEWVKSINHFNKGNTEGRQVVETNTYVFGIPAYQLVYTDSSPFHSTPYSTYVCTYFEFEGCLWILEWRSYEVTAKPPEYYIHLLETFVIHQQ